MDSEVDVGSDGNNGVEIEMAISRGVFPKGGINKNAGGGWGRVNAEEIACRCRRGTCAPSKWPEIVVTGANFGSGRHGKVR